MLTPDGTWLQSFHRHDFKQHKDVVTGETYMLDGGCSYIRSNVNKVPAYYLTVLESDRHELKREWFAWGTRGKDGKQPLRWVHLKNMDTDHIEAILETQHHIGDWLRKLFNDELEYRNKVFPVKTENGN